MSEQYPVTIAVRRADGGTEHVRVGTATRTNEGFSLSLGELSIGAQPEPARASRGSYSNASASPMGASAAGGMVFPNYGRSKGAPIYGASQDDLQFYANGARRSLADPSKARFHDKERTLLAAIEAEMTRQSGDGGGQGYLPEGDEDIPPPSDEDAPF